ncbi:GNAT family N-acetyltransferase [Spirilliplanes yamanashiensis]|uniref:Alanine acetyltransferase n=1 Tax=Spirilliplanes yamanashiensis TaxID=42233 RepID=A0A8J3YDG3_9ACTN|nr:GNAT family protein [Spirilliplanes yamanashiensis]MDP9816207.1 ribosomal-protein-alanine N-acetyltransferase [Spirilliplanes yamanashiensis]GIJ05732.1 alanine acetyltransferase [Spirilliplanes yamanashiensis]
MTELPGGVTLRTLETADAPALLDALLRNREHLRPYEPERPPSHWTLDGQQRRVESLVRRRAEGSQYNAVLVRDGRVLGMVALSQIALGPFRSASLGYWVDAAETGRGLASAAVSAICTIADTDLGLHRVEAGTLVGNTASQRVLLRNGFTEYGFAPNYLHIDGRWRDHRLFQRILGDAWPGVTPARGRP